MGKRTLNLLKILPIFFAVLLAVFCLIPNKAELHVNAAQDSNFTNLIVFAKFKDEEEFLDDNYSPTSVKQLTENSYSLADYSVKDYYQKVSNGKLNMQNLYLFDNGNSLTLNNYRGYYCTNLNGNEIGYNSWEYSLRMSELRQDWGNAITEALKTNSIQNFDGTKTYGITDLDKNKDGYIDNITIIYKYSTEYSVSWADCLWNYQSYSYNINLNDNGKTITSNSYVQLTANYSGVYSTTPNGMKFVNLQTMIHETGHVFGLKDLYKSTEENPVYYMSAMAKAVSPIPQYISVKEREILGWLNEGNVQTIHTGGEYTINVTTSDIASGVICYKCNVPSINKTLYMEYRKFNGTENKYDAQNRVLYDKNGEKLKNLTFESGLVCFLLEKGTEFPNNLNVVNNNWNYQVIGGNYKTKSDAALMLGESVLVSTNLSVEVTNVTDTQLTFSLTGTDIESEHTHTYTKVDYKDSTCAEAGSIEHYTCNTCNKNFILNGENYQEVELSQTVINKKEHSYELVTRKDSTCLTTGNIEYYKCTDCNKCFILNGENYQEIALSQTVINKKQHVPKLVKGKDATCTEKGLTDGYICENCSTVLTEQQEISKTKHVSSDWIVDKVASADENGLRHKECVNCKQVLESETLYYEGEPIEPPIVDPDQPSGDKDPSKEEETPTIEPSINNKPKEISSPIIVVSVLGGAGVVSGVVIFIIKRRRY